MRRRLSLTLLAVLVMLAIAVPWGYRSLRSHGVRRVASTGAPRDSLTRLDGTARADSQRAADTVCFASRIGLPCDPR